MMLSINGKTIEAQTGKSILDLIQELGLDCSELSSRPLAAKIAGEVFTLNYIPVRQKEAEAEQELTRKAMAASDGRIRLLHYGDAAGKEVYTRTACFVAFLAIGKLWPDSVARVSCTLGNSIYISVSNAEAFCTDKLKSQMQELIAENFPLIRRRISISDAIEGFLDSGQSDKAELLQWRNSEYFDVYSYGHYSDYFYGEMLPSSGYLTVWDILPADNGFVVLYPDDLNPNQPSKFSASPNFFNVFTEGERWGELMECATVADLNRLTESGQVRELIRVNEALHEKRFSHIADMVCSRDCHVVMLAGPSSSGKTTSANRLATQLRVHGKKPILMSLDNYYIDRDKILPDADGKVDLEHINTIDTALFRQNISEILSGKTVELPSFNFVTGKREWNHDQICLDERSVIIVEGIHGLNPQLLPAGVQKEQIFKLYVSPLLPLNMDNHNRIPTSYLRLLRRIVRDYETRGSSVQRTLSMWESVQNGEKRWIFPYQENADVIFNSSTLYELAVLKKHIFPLLTAVEPEDECYDQVRSIVKVLNYIRQADVDDEIPPTSIVREFVGGNSFYR